MMSILQAAIEDAAAVVVTIATRLALKNPRQQLNPKESKAPGIPKMGRSGTVAAETFRRRDEDDGQKGKSKLHIQRLLIQ